MSVCVLVKMPSEKNIRGCVPTGPALPAEIDKVGFSQRYARKLRGGGGIYSTQEAQMARHDHARRPINAAEWINS